MLKIYSFVVAFSLIFGFGTLQAKEIGLRNFSGYKVIRALATTVDQYEVLANLQENVELGLDFWSDPVINHSTDIMVSSEQMLVVDQILKENDIQFSTFIEDLEKKISEERNTNLKNFNGRMNWESYQRMDTIYDWMIVMGVLYPQWVTIYSIGKSYQSRDLRVMVISKPNPNITKKAFWIDGGIHAREWISPATVTYAINELLTNNAEYTELLDNLDFYFLPIVNPDGYEYSHVTDRMWRRTRQPHDPLGLCVGVDANRNFGFQFGGPGSSPVYCSETYRGPSAYSEPETLAVKNFIETAQNVEWTAFITTHSYSQLFMTPYGYTKNLTADYPELENLGLDFAEAVFSEYGTEYRVGSAANILYESSGSSRDWAKGEGGFKYVYTIELRDKGEHGFILPPDQIIPTGRETWKGLIVVANYLIGK